MYTHNEIAETAKDQMTRQVVAMSVIFVVFAIVQHTF